MRVAAIALGVAVAACGTPSPDLFVVQRGGTVPGAELRLLVSDGTVRCNGGDERPLSSDQLLEARALTTDLLGTSQAEIPPSDAQFFSFRVQTEEGTLRFADTTTRPPVIPRLVRFTRELARGVCGLPR